MSDLRTWRLRARGDCGSISLELAVLAPGLLLIVAILVAGGRIALAGQGVEAAASDAAREASIARSKTEATGNGESAAQQSLAQQGLHCTSTTVDIDTSGFNTPPGTPATITATVTCVVRLTDAAFPGVPGARTITATAHSPLDTYRERQ
jgi:Flp pilus assembly protein TadG